MVNITKETGLYIAVFIVIVALVLFYVYGRGSGGVNLQVVGQSVSAAQLATLSNIANNNTLANMVGAGITRGGPSAVTGSSLLVNGKPGIVYIGAEWCPFCAITNWGLTLALMRFGSFGSLHYTASDPGDIYPNTATFTFHNSTYSSSMIAFIAAETQNRSRAQIENTNPIENQTNQKYGTGSIPFVDIANASVLNGAPVSPQIIQGMNWSQVVSSLSAPNSTVAQGIIGEANIFTAYICKSSASLKNTTTCKQPYIKTITG